MDCEIVQRARNRNFIKEKKKKNKIRSFVCSLIRKSLRDNETNRCNMLVWCASCIFFLSSLHISIRVEQKKKTKCKLIDGNFVLYCVLYWFARLFFFFFLFNLFFSACCLFIEIEFRSQVNKVKHLYQIRKQAEGERKSQPNVCLNQVFASSHTRTHTRMLQSMHAKHLEKSAGPNTHTHTFFRWTKKTRVSTELPRVLFCVSPFTSTRIFSSPFWAVLSNHYKILNQFYCTICVPVIRMMIPSCIDRSMKTTFEWK